MDTLLLRSLLYFTILKPNKLHSTSLHLSTLHLFPFKLHPTTLHYEDISALCKESTALHSVPPQSLVTQLFCVLRIIFWPILFVYKVSCLFVASLCLHFFLLTFFRLYHVITFSAVYRHVLACLCLYSSAGLLPYKAESRSKTLPGFCSFVRK
jgi:hypothetical protein